MGSLLGVSVWCTALDSMPRYIDRTEEIVLSTDTLLDTIAHCQWGTDGCCCWCRCCGRSRRFGQRPIGTNGRWLRPRLKSVGPGLLSSLLNIAFITFGIVGYFSKKHKNHHFVWWFMACEHMWIINIVFFNKRQQQWLKFKVIASEKFACLSANIFLMSMSMAYCFFQARFSKKTCFEWFN